jgi:hypothetical protein
LYTVIKNAELVWFGMSFYKHFTVIKVKIWPGQILEQNSMLRMQEMAFPGFEFQKFSGGHAPRPT